MAISGSLGSGSSTRLCSKDPPGGAAGLRGGPLRGPWAVAGLQPRRGQHRWWRAAPEALELRTAVGRADGILISSPEYAHGIPGSLKNPLDWLVGSVEFPDKPVALIKTSARAVHAHAQLVEVLTTMSARLVDNASLLNPIPPGRVGAEAIIADEGLLGMLQGALAETADAINEED